MEKMLFNLGLNFTAAKLIPYLFFTLLGVGLAYFAFRRNLNPSLKWTLVVLLAIVPFLLYFAIYPIYNGDFSNKPFECRMRNSYTSAVEDGLLVMAIPGCPYCSEAIDELKKMKDRNPKLEITFMVLGDALNEEPYRDLSEGKFKVISCDNPPLFNTTVGYSYPTFMKVKEGMAVQYWTNNEFGVRAKDDVVNSY